MGVKVLSPTSSFPTWGVWQWEEETSVNLAYKASRFWSQDFHRTGGNRNSTIGGHTQGIMCTRTQGKKQWPHKRLGQTYLLVLEGLLQRQGASVANCKDEDTDSSSSDEYSLVWACLEAAIPFPRPNPTQEPVDSRLPTEQEHSPTHQQTGCLKSSWAEPCPPEG